MWLDRDKDFRMGNVERGSAQWYQVAVLVQIRAETGLNSVLEVGPGRGVNGVLLKHVGFTYSTLSDLPSQVGLESPLFQNAIEERVADIVCAFQVLEHNSLKSLGTNLRKMASLSRAFVVVSLPVSMPYIRFEFEPKLWSGYSVTARTRYSKILFLPRRLLPRPNSKKWRSILGSSKLASDIDELGREVLASHDHMWEIGEKGAGLRQIVGVAEQENLELVRLSYAPFFPQQVFLEFQRVKLAKLS
jgi:hypothetical protein